MFTKHLESRCLTTINEWVLAFIKEKIVGFSALDITKVDKGQVVFTFSYVLPEFRHIKIYDRMFSARLRLVEKDTDAKRIKAVCTGDSAPCLKAWIY